MNSEADIWESLSLMKGNSVAAVGQKIKPDRNVATIATRGQQVDNAGGSMFAQGCRASARDSTVIAQWREGRWAANSLQQAHLQPVEILQSKLWGGSNQ